MREKVRFCMSTFAAPYPMRYISREDGLIITGNSRIDVLEKTVPIELSD